MTNGFVIFFPPEMQLKFEHVKPMNKLYRFQGKNKQKLGKSLLRITEREKKTKQLS